MSLRSIRPVLAATAVAALLAACSEAATAPAPSAPSAPAAKPSAALISFNALRFTEQCTGTTCTFDASNSSGFTSYTWYFGDGTSATGIKVTHTFANPNGTYGLMLSGASSTNITAWVRKVVACSNGTCF